MKRVHIPNSVESIGERAFHYCWSLLEVELPNSVIKIGSFAFADCCKLTRVSIGTGVVSIPAGVFVNCTNLMEVPIPSQIKLIERRAFRECTALEQITIPGSVESIGESAFAGCDALAKVVIGIGVEKIGERAFEGCSGLLEVEIPSSVKQLEESIFASCIALKKATVPSSVETIPHGTFYMCKALVDVTISLAAVKCIGRYSFLGCDHPDLVVNLGEVDGIDAPNKFECLNGVTRRATLRQELPAAGGFCIVVRVWPAGDHDGHGNYSTSEPEPPILVDGSGITAPLELQDLSGDEYVVNGWGNELDKDLKQLAVKQNPKLVGQNWSVLLHNTDVEVDNVNLQDVGNMVVQGWLDLAEPILVTFDRKRRDDALDKADEAAASKRGKLRDVCV